eukprot:4733855-Prymnesium_polylepis.1
MPFLEPPIRAGGIAGISALSEIRTTPKPPQTTVSQNLLGGGSEGDRGAGGGQGGPKGERRRPPLEPYHLHGP